MTFTPRVDEREGGAGSGLTYRYTLSVDITDEGGETRTATRSFRLGFVSVEASIAAANGFGRTGVPQRLHDHAHRPQRDAQAGKGDLARRPPPPARDDAPSGRPAPSRAARPGRSARRSGRRATACGPRWESPLAPEKILRLWKEGPEAARGAAEHGADGRAAVVRSGSRSRSLSSHLRNEGRFRRRLPREPGLSRLRPKGLGPPAAFPRRGIRLGPRRRDGAPPHSQRLRRPAHALRNVQGRRALGAPLARRPERTAAFWRSRSRRTCAADSARASPCSGTISSSAKRPASSSRGTTRSWPCPSPRSATSSFPAAGRPGGSRSRPRTASPPSRAPPSSWPTCTTGASISSPRTFRPG